MTAATIIHTITTHTQHITVGRDLLPLWIHIIPTLGTVLIAGLALRQAKDQGDRTRNLVAEQNEIARNKVKTDMFPERFEAWNRLSVSANGYYMTVISITREQTENLDIEKESLIAFDEAATKAFLLFDDDVTNAVNEFRESLRQLLNLKIQTFMNHVNYIEQNSVSNAFGRGLDRCEEAKKALRNAVRNYMPIQT